MDRKMPSQIHQEPEPTKTPIMEGECFATVDQVLIKIQNTRPAPAIRAAPNQGEAKKK